MKTGWMLKGCNEHGAKYYTRYIDHTHAELVQRDIEDFIQCHDDIHHVEATFVYFPESVGVEDQSHPHLEASK